MSIYIGGTQIKDIYIGTRMDYSAMQGPCSNGFHVPSSTEWNNAINIYKSLGGTRGDNFGTALKLPFAGNRSYSSSNVGSSGSRGYYSAADKQDNTTAYELRFYSAGFISGSYGEKGTGRSIRPFKDTPVVPTSSWTKTYGTSIEAGGIFWNATDGLISLSSDGTNWITIADKNLGATSVWNSGNTLSQANCGYFYQWGNNYGFPRTGSVTTSSTRVNAGTYGPGNYYSSSTFIIVSTSPYTWDSSNNPNLRGGETGAVSVPAKVSEVYVGTTKVRPSIINFATQGPCPDGFHVPTRDEWINIRDMGISLGAWTSSGGGNMQAYLWLPSNGYRGTTSVVYNQGSSVYLRGSTSNSNGWSGTYLSLTNSSISISTNDAAAGGGVRPFKNKPVTPDSSRIVRYQGSGNAGIYRSEALQLISISTDGVNRVTIADRNLGATTGGISSTAYGYYYQRGNNYGFANSGSITTASGMVDASTYGPGNYYSSSIFRTGNSDWDSSHNKNKRGGVDGNVPV